MTTLQNRVSALLADPFQTVFNEFQPGAVWNGNGSRSSPQKVAPFSVWEDGQSFHLTMDVPGIALEDLDVSINKGRLTIKGQRKFPDPSPDFSYREQFFGEFERTIMLQEWLDPASIEATLQHGVLHLTLAKKPEAQRQKIAINYCDGSDVKRIETSK